MKGLLLDSESGDLLIEGGRSVVGDTESQSIMAVVCSMRGELKEEPLLGGEAVLLRGGSEDPFWAGRVKRMLKRVGIDWVRVRVEGETITIE